MPLRPTNVWVSEVFYAAIEYEVDEAFNARDVPVMDRAQLRDTAVKAVIAEVLKHAWPAGNC